jgi:hypothetical protein
MDCIKIFKIEFGLLNGIIQQPKTISPKILNITQNNFNFIPWWGKDKKYV